ncbi:ubp14 [Candida pseudojiufengensis]|uniref:ubp14 n=1 Tax=Candida pseudojiufengensis TaxID=497109 RepID=UPI002224DD10|nr:ubp14 [Candida pseudojiufengensis]KAI5960137.1 ubp14 [Candida pseudojiufengensis]
MTLQLPSDIPSRIPSGSKIYKDDCMYTFDTPENNELGLDIDLKTYKAYSRNNDYNFTANNYEKTGNKYYLNINKTKKPREEIDKLLYDGNGEKHSKIPKLEIKNVKDEDYYNIDISVYDVEEDKYYRRDEISNDFNNLIEQILEANSSNKNDEIHQWEQEIVPCPHSVDVQQFETSLKPDLGQCSQCDLKENLWICLHCGVLGCGRKQYGSSLNGNGHALQHYESTQHPVALKLGSLSSNPDSCDAYCYQCNDEVKVPNLSAILQKYGINLSDSVKTEKSLIEMNIDQNMNWDFKDDEKLKPVYGKSLTGFQNLGNSCYLNSVIQSLFDLEPYKSYFENLEFDFDVQNPAEDLKSQLIKIYDGLYSGRYSKSGSIKGEDYQIGIKPSTFKTLIGQNHPEFQTSKQQDAFEFLLYLMESLDKNFGLILNSKFNFLFADKVICSNCKYGSLKDESIDNLALPLEDEVLNVEDGKKIYKKTTLMDSFKKLTAPEIIEGFKCDNCSSGKPAIKSSGFVTFPNYLIVNVQRIKLENWAPYKADVPVEIPYELDLAEFKAPKFSETETQVESNVSNDDSSSFQPNQVALDTLLAMGFPEPRCIKALYITGNKDPEAAMNWLFEHMEDADIDVPLDLNSSTSKSVPVNETSEELINQLVSMGFSTQLSKKALHVNSGDVNAAVEWLFSNPDDDGVIEESGIKATIDLKSERLELKKTLQNQTNTNSTKYNLKSVICHKGSSPHTGHYVSFIRKEIDNEIKWVLFNDEKVVLCDDSNLQDIENNSYIYIFEMVDLS